MHGEFLLNEVGQNSNLLFLGGDLQRRIAYIPAFLYRARNNFRIVSGHDDRPNSFLLDHVSFLAGQMYMMNYFRGP